MVGGRGAGGMALYGRTGPGTSARAADCLRASVRFQTSSEKASSSLRRHLLWKNAVMNDFEGGINMGPTRK
jgi:hypothetical protein